MEIDGKLVLELRELASQGVRPAALVPVIARAVGIDVAHCRLYAIAYFREAFHLSIADAKRIGAAACFVGKEGGDDVLNAEISRIIDGTKTRWWPPNGRNVQ